jgi:ribosomal protein S18 acetylase RimI-like enzyme
MLSKKISKKIDGDETMMEYLEVSCEEIDLIRPLWEELRAHQARKSLRFSSDLAEVTWEKRKKNLLKSDKELKLIIAKGHEYIGYCISSIANGNKGEVESLFIKDEYRHAGVGTEFMKRSLEWFQHKMVDDISINVVVGNEEVLDFYRRFGFEPRSVSLKKLK